MGYGTTFILYTAAVSTCLSMSTFFSGVNFRTVVLHELGHVLGIHHIPVLGSVMYPGYRPTLGGKLTDGDIAALQDIYGIPKGQKRISRKQKPKTKLVPRNQRPSSSTESTAEGDSSRRSSEKSSHDSSRQTSEKSSHDSSRQTSEKSSHDSSRQRSEKSSRDLSRQTSEKSSHDSSRETSEETSSDKSTAETREETSSQNSSEKTVEESSQVSSEKSDESSEEESAAASKRNRRRRRRRRKHDHNDPNQHRRQQDGQTPLGSWVRSILQRIVG